MFSFVSVSVVLHLLLVLRIVVRVWLDISKCSVSVSVCVLASVLEPRGASWKIKMCWSV